MISVLVYLLMLKLLYVVGLPLAPKQSNVTYVHNSSSVTITWLPSVNGGNVLYSVECSRCKSAADNDCFNNFCGALLTFYPKRDQISWLNVTIGGLRTLTKYKFTVYSVNEVTKSVPRSKWNYLEIFATTSKGKKNLLHAFDNKII